MANSLNIPRNKQQFEQCPYVEDMTAYQLRVLHARLVDALHELSNAVEQRAPDVANAIDNILSGYKFRVADIVPNENCAKFGDVVLKFLMRDRVFQIIDVKTNEVYNTLKAVHPDKLKTNNK